MDIITALSIHPNMKSLNLDGNRIRTNGCIALAILLKCSVAALYHLDLSNNEIDDEGIDVLVPALRVVA